MKMWVGENVTHASNLRRRKTWIVLVRANKWARSGLLWYEEAERASDDRHPVNDEAVCAFCLRDSAVQSLWKEQEPVMVVVMVIMVSTQERRAKLDRTFIPPFNQCQEAGTPHSHFHTTNIT